MVGQRYTADTFPRDIRYKYTWQAGAMNTSGTLAQPFGEYFLPDYDAPA